MVRVAIVGVCLLASGCPGDDGGGGGVVLFHEDFAAGFPAPNWVGDGVIDTTSGAPAPSLRLRPTPPVVSATVQAANPIQVGGGLTFRFSAAALTEGVARVYLNDAQAGGQPLGSVVLRGAQSIEYAIFGTTSAIQPIGGPDAQFHTFEFVFAPGGTSTWSRDGAIQLQGSAANTATLARVLVDTTSPSGLLVDELEITSR